MRLMAQAGTSFDVVGESNRLKIRELWFFYRELFGVRGVALQQKGLESCLVVR